MLRLTVPWNASATSCAVKPPSTFHSESTPFGSKSLTASVLPRRDDDRVENARIARLSVDTR
jgi:hypothetical protein